MPVVVETIAGLRAQLRIAIADAASAGLSAPRVALVPTMGALHAGHLALVERARQSAEIVVVSIFVNPLQFDDARDLERYPHAIESDVDRLGAHGVQFVFAPSVAEMYPNGGARTAVTAGASGMRFEGHSRRGHFDGVLTVVAKLLNIVRPNIVVFGEKDAQQVFLVRRMVADLNVDVEVASVATVREEDGLALSSRNAFLDAGERRAARALSLALEAAESSADRGTDAALAAAQSVLSGDPVVRLDYLSIVDPATFLPVDTGHHGRAVVLVAATIGDVRLIDNQALYLG